MSLGKISCLGLAVAFVGVAQAALAQQGQSRAVPHGSSACPETRAYIEQSLSTRPEDGRLYDLQRQAVRMPVRELVRMMGGIERAYLIAEQTRAEAQAHIDRGAQGGQRRFHQDTILRADALIEILDCMQSGEGA